MTEVQRVRYILEAQQGFAACEADNTAHDAPSFEQWRHREVAYALGRGKRFRDFDQMDLTRCLIHFSALKRGERLPVEVIAARAEQRQEFGRLAPLRELWDSIETGVRIAVLRDRFKMSFFEELATLPEGELRKARWTLERLAKRYPKGRTTCTT